MMNVPHPSLQHSLRWVLVGEESDDTVEEGVSFVRSLGDAKADAVLLDMVAAAYLAPGVRPRPHAIVVRAREKQRGDYPALVVVSPSYGLDRKQRPSGIDMVRGEGRLVGDAIVVARSSGLRLDSVVVPETVFDAYVVNEAIDKCVAIREFIQAATAALRSTLPKDQVV